MNKDSLTLEEKLRINADLVIQHLSQHAGFELAYDQQSVEWIDGFVERQRAREDFNLASAEGLVQNLGSFLGESLRCELGGVWKQLDDGLAIVFRDGNAAFPFNKVRKQFANGNDDSIAGFYKSAAVLFR